MLVASIKQQKTPAKRQMNSSADTFFFISSLFRFSSLTIFLHFSLLMIMMLIIIIIATVCRWKKRKCASSSIYRTLSASLFHLSPGVVSRFPENDYLAELASSRKTKRGKGREFLFSFFFIFFVLYGFRHTRETNFEKENRKLWRRIWY